LKVVNDGAGKWSTMVLESGQPWRVVNHGNWSTMVANHGNWSTMVLWKVTQLCSKVVNQSRTGKWSISAENQLQLTIN